MDIHPCDLILVVNDGKEFKAHRNVLSEASPFFDKFLNCDMKENKEGVVRLEMFTDAQMADVLQFIYNGDVQISTREDAENLFVAGDYLLLSKLKSVAAEFLAKDLSTLNCVSTFHIANMYYCEKLSRSGGMGFQRRNCDQRRGRGFQDHFTLD